MKTFLITNLFLLFSIALFSQQTIKGDPVFKTADNFREEFLNKKRQAIINYNNKSSICDVDTLRYSRFKTTDSNLYIGVYDSNALGVGQFFQNRDSMTILGANIYCYVPSSFSGSQSGTVNVYFANNKKIPVGAKLATANVSVPYTFVLTTSNINTVKRTVMFAQPLTTVYDFVMTFEADNPVSISYACNSWTNKDGKGKNFGVLKLKNGVWYNALNVNIGGVTFDADFFIEPIVQYKLKSDFDQLNISCLGNGKPFKFVNTTQPILFEAFNPLMVKNKTKESFEWDYGDGSAKDTVLHGDNLYTSSSITSYSVDLKTAFTGWTMQSACVDVATKIISKPNLDAKFTPNINKATVSFNNSSVDGKIFNWDFGDGNTDTLKSPTHTYAAPGLYKVRLVAYNYGCVDSATSVIQIKTTGVDEKKNAFMKVYPNPVVDVLTIENPELINSPYHVEVYSILGEKVMNFDWASDSYADKFSFQVNLLQSGRYFVKISNSKSGEILGTSSFVKQ